MFRKKSGQKGFTLIELMIVVAVIGILATVIVPRFSGYRVKAYNAAATSDVRNAYTAAQAYFIDNPDGTPSLDDLKAYGFNQTKNVTVTTTVTSAGGAIMAKHNSTDSGVKTYMIDDKGVMTFAE